MQRQHAEAVRADGTVDVATAEIEDIKAFFDHVKIKRKDVKREGVFSEPVDKVNGKFVLNSASHVGGYRSAVKYIYEQQKVDFPAVLEKGLERFTGAYKRVKNKRKQDGDEDPDEGKMPMQFSGYQWLATEAMRSDADFSQATFAHSFVTLCWNLIARSTNVRGPPQFRAYWVAR